MSAGRQLPVAWEDPASESGWTSSGRRQPSAPKRVVFLIDYGMISHGLAPLFIDGHATELSFWGFSSDIIRRLTRLNELYDRQINWDNPNDPTWRLSERDRNEFNALLAFVVSEIQVALGDRWQIVLESGPI